MKKITATILVALLVEVIIFGIIYFLSDSDTALRIITGISYIGFILGIAVLLVNPNIHSVDRLDDIIKKYRDACPVYIAFMSFCVISIFYYVFLDVPIIPHFYTYLISFLLSILLPTLLMLVLGKELKINKSEILKLTPALCGIVWETLFVLDNFV